jgi:hypothetical protein
MGSASTSVVRVSDVRSESVSAQAKKKSAPSCRIAKMSQTAYARSGSSVKAVRDRFREIREFMKADCDGFRELSEHVKADHDGFREV